MISHKRRPFCSSIFTLFFVCSLILTGCAIPSDTAEPDAYLAAIYQNYPQLKEKKPERTSVERVVDGDTLETGNGDKVRLIGVDTPEVYGGAEYFGKEASAYSKEQLTGKQVLLFQDVSETDRYGRLLRYLFIQGETVMYNEKLISEGYANAATFPPDVLYSEYFVEKARTAREAQAGLWNESRTPATQDQPVASAACENPEIKGNINARGERIYHMPGSRYYKQTIAEQMFCTEDEAVAEGYRKPAGQ